MSFLRYVFVFILGITGTILIFANFVSFQAKRLDLPLKEFPYSFSKAPYIHPNILKELSTWLSDTGDQVVALNLMESQDSNRYSGDVKIRKVEEQDPFVYARKGKEEFGYQYVGMTDSGVHVLFTSSCGGGSGYFKNLLLLSVEYDEGVDFNWEGSVIQANEKRLLIKKLGEIALGDRWAGELTLKGNKLFVGKDTGLFSVSGGKGGGNLSQDRKGRVLSIDINP